MKLASAISLVALAAAPAFASASQSFLVDFEKNWTFNAVDNTYASQGVSFTNVLGVSNGDGLGSLNANGDYYANAPTAQGVAFVQLDGVVNTTSFMNVAGGVEGALSFFYSSPTALTGAIKAYSGLNGSGTLLGSFDLSANAPTGYDTWTQAYFGFSGTALSFDLTGTANTAALDNISAVPEPTSALLALACIVPFGVQALARRRRG